MGDGAHAQRQQQGPSLSAHSGSATGNASSGKAARASGAPAPVPGAQQQHSLRGPRGVPRAPRSRLAPVGAHQQNWSQLPDQCMHSPGLASILHFCESDACRCCKDCSGLCLPLIGPMG